MTTTIKITSHNYPARVFTTDDNGQTSERVLWPEHGEQIFHCTTSSEVLIKDLEYDDPRAVAAKPPA